MSKALDAKYSAQPVIFSIQIKDRVQLYKIFGPNLLNNLYEKKKELNKSWTKEFYYNSVVSLFLSMVIAQLEYQIPSKTISLLP